MEISKAVKGFLLTRATDLSQNTVELYTWALGIMCEFFGKVEIEDLTKEDMHKFFEYVMRGYVPTRKNKKEGPLAPRSVENVWTAMRSFFNWAEEESFIKERPDKSIKRPRYKLPPIMPFTDEEILALLKSCEYSRVAAPTNRNSFVMRRPTAARDAALISVLLDTGVRVSECSRINIEDVNMDTGEIKITPFGTGVKTNPRIVVIGKASKKAVWKYLSKRDDPNPSDPLFATVDGFRMNRNSIRLILDEIGKAAEVAHCHPHRFRHTFATFFLRNGGNVFDLQKILGHSTFAMVKKYVELTNQDLLNSHRLASPMDRLKK